MRAGLPFAREGPLVQSTTGSQAGLPSAVPPPPHGTETGSCTMKRRTGRIDDRGRRNRSRGAMRRFRPAIQALEERQLLATAYYQNYMDYWSQGNWKLSYGGDGSAVNSDPSG